MSKLRFPPCKPTTFCILCLTLILGVCYFCNDDAALLYAQREISKQSASNPEMASESDDLSNELRSKEKSNKLIREGTVVRSQRVLFRIAGNRTIMIVHETSERFYCLECLNLERITKIMNSNPSMTDWNVDYLVTEYQGTNYVLLHRAVLTSSKSS